MQQVDKWITALVKGKTFADIGGLWGTENEKVTVAAKAAAQEVTMIDITPLGSWLWQRFDDRCTSLGVSGHRCIEADINNSVRVAEIGNFDVVHCSGVLYHAPNPLHSLVHIAKICSKVMILGSAVIPPSISNTYGTLSLEPGSALFVPALNEAQKAVIGQYFKEVGAQELIGVTAPSNYAIDDYGPWWWLFTAECLAALLTVAGFEIIENASDWENRTALYLAQRVSA